MSSSPTPTPPIPHATLHPSPSGHYGPFGGTHYPPSAHPHLTALTTTFTRLRTTPSFLSHLTSVRHTLQGRPTPLHHLLTLTSQIRTHPSTPPGHGADIYVKREDLNHTGAHKINHCVGFALLAKEMGKTKLIAETGAGQHGVALATAAAYFGLQCDVYMGAVDVRKQGSNVGRMRILGARVVGVGGAEEEEGGGGEGKGNLKDASDAALQAYLREADTALYAIGSAIGPHPFPWIVREFQKVVGEEARGQWQERFGEGDLPEHVVACVAGGSNALGMYTAFVDDKDVVLHAVEPLGRSGELGQHAATLSYGRPGKLHGAESLVIQDEDDSPAKVRSVASGLVYPGIGPEMALLHQMGRLKVSTISDEEVIDTFFRLAKTEGLIVALESAHALAFAIKLAAQLPSTERILVNLSGRGDKDVDYVLEHYGYERPDAKI